MKKDKGKDKDENKNTRSDEMILKSGSFTFSLRCAEGLKWFSICNTAGNWRVEYRDDQPISVVMQSLCRQAGNEQALECMASMMFMLTTVIPDKDFIGAFTKAYESMIERHIARCEESESDDKADSAALDDVKVKYNLDNDIDGNA